MQTGLAVMARCPRIGEGKTRLARAIGAAPAYRLYRAFLRDIDLRFARGRRTLLWAFHPPEADFAALTGCSSRCVPQQGDDLGARMRHCFQTLCDEGFERVIMIGADVPHVRDAWLDEAEGALGEADLVLGPSEDGGYYLVAMRASHDVFSGIPMGTNRVLAETLTKAAAAGLRVHLLPPSFDVDEASDLRRLWKLVQRDGCDVQLAHTAAVLADLLGDDVED
jgi:rSAM/selenodomain-associated transferase 1